MNPSQNVDFPRPRPTSLICCVPNMEIVSKSSSSSTSGCISGDGSFESSTCLLPKTLSSEKDLKIKDNASKQEILEAITRCKDLILTNEQCSDERKWLVRHLIELRYRLQDMKDDDFTTPRLAVSTRGHHFRHQTVAYNTKQYCDHCSGVIWGIVQGSYICDDCNYLCHSKCVDNICRVCAHVSISETGRLEMRICPEKGLAAQDYKCAECGTCLAFKNGWIEPRLCDYTGYFYCTTCHWNDYSYIPARIVHNWDWDKRPVSRFAYQLLQITNQRPIIDVEGVNRKLFTYIAEFEWVHKMRKDLLWMRRYLCECTNGSALLTPVIMQLGDSVQKYSMLQLLEIHDGSLLSKLTKLTEECRSHITKCALCSGKGYICEICGNNEVLYPFDSGAVLCNKCNSLYHRNCWRRKNEYCVKCKRVNERRKLKGPEPVVTLDSLELDIDKYV